MISEEFIDFITPLRLVNILGPVFNLLNVPVEVIIILPYLSPGPILLLNEAKQLVYRLLVFAIYMDHVVHILRLGADLLVQLFEPFHELEALPLHDLRDLFIEVFEHLFSLCCLVRNILLYIHHVILKLVHCQGELSEVLRLWVVL